MTNFSILIPSVALLLLTLVVIFIPLRDKKRLSQLGPLLLEIKRKKTIPIMPIGICILVAIFIVYLFFQDFTLFISTILAATGVMGAAIALSDTFFRLHSGVYEKGLVLDGRLVKKEHFIAFPQLHYEHSDKTDIVENVLKAVLESGETYLVFDSLEEKESVIAIIRNWEQR